MTCGIYRITHRATARHYVGLSVDIERRWRSHRAAKAAHTSHISNAIKKHGASAFDFVVLETCSVDELPAAEIRWIANLGSQRPHGFNGTTGGDRPTYTEDVRAKVSARLTNLWAQPEFRKLVMNRIREAKGTAEFKERHSVAVRAAMAGIQHLASVRAYKGAQTRATKSPEEIERTRAAWAASTRALWADPVRAAEVRAKRSAALKGKTRSPETRERMAAAKRAWWAARKQQLPD